MRVQGEAPRGPGASSSDSESAGNSERVVEAFIAEGARSVGFFVCRGGGLLDLYTNA